MSEVLAIGVPLPAALLGSWPVRQRVGDVVAVLDIAAADVAEVAVEATLLLVRVEGGGVRVLGDEGVLEQMDAGARLFVDGWRAGGRDKPTRRGEGLSWDAEGFSPP